MFLFLQSWVFLWNITISVQGYTIRFQEFPDDKQMQGHVSSVWMFWIFMPILFMLLTGGLCCYHTFLITTAQTTWEHSRRECITYLKIYDRSILPFYISISENIKRTTFHGGKC
jgi:hypothetical protein